MRAAYPHRTHGQYSEREGNLIRTEYFYLDPPIPREVAARLEKLPASGHPFTSSGTVQQGYLYRFGLDALHELVFHFDTNWPRWVIDAMLPLIFRDYPLLMQFITEIENLRLGKTGKHRHRYKPLMLLAAIRTVLQGFPIAFSEGPLLEYYRAFGEAVGVDSSRPEYPYFHLSGDGFWTIIDADGKPFTAHRPRSKYALRGTRVQFAGERLTCITDDQLRPYVLGAVKTYFTDDEWSRLTEVWPELATAKDPSWRPRSRTDNAAPEPLPDLQAVTDSFYHALQRSHLRYDAAFVRAFVASLATKPFVILTGLSGSGKTQIALQFGHWLGRDQVLLVPVRPDWTGSDALFGYEDALKPPAPDGRRAWHVPAALRFMLQAARDPDWPYVLILDEMNLAHVERYFADVLSGMESGEPCLPNLAQDEEDGAWRLIPDEPEFISVPDNLFIVGTVNVDETTYMFSPKVLDRANTLDFRVHTDDLTDDLRKPVPCEPGPEELVRGFLVVAKDGDWHVDKPHSDKDVISQQLRRLHAILHTWGFEFGHRVFSESLRFAAMLAAAGELSVEAALDAIVMQKILPRLHGNRRRLEPVLAAVGAFAFDPDAAPVPTAAERPAFDPLRPPADPGEARLPRSFEKVQRMMASLRANQFAGFAV